MRRSRSSLSPAAILVLGITLLTGIVETAGAQDRNYLLATATPGGTYYPVGVALATLTKVRLQPQHGVSLSAISSAGSGENLKLLREDQAQFAILQGLYGAWAWHGRGPIEAAGPQRFLRSVTMLWENVEHLIIASDKAGTGTAADIAALTGSKFSIGRRNSGTEGSGRHILSALGTDPETLDLVYLGYGASAEALINGNIDGMNIPAGPPVAAVTRAFAALGDRIRILDFTDEQIAAANREYPLWSRYLIPADTYPGQEKPVHSIAQPNFLAVRADVDEEAVYLITKAIYENLPFLAGIHRATKAMSLERAVTGLPVPLHPGAARYFRERGLAIPPELAAP
ncbi:MAG: TAXI family TRAP transporter solute-binding subunit [Pseudomonadota bacterium]